MITFKKQNSKQRAYAEKSIAEARNRIAKIFLFSILGLYSIVGVASTLTSGGDKQTIIEKIFVGGSGVSIAAVTMATIGNIDEVSDKESAGNQLSSRIYLVARDQIDNTVAFPTVNASRERGSIPLKAGEYMHYIDTVENSVGINSTGEKGDITTDYTNTGTMIIAGNRDQVLNLLEEYAGRGFVIIYFDTNKERYMTAGSFYKPMILKSYERKDDKEGRYVSCSFESKHWQQPVYYTGTITTAPAKNVAADSTTLAIDSSTQYQLADGTGAAAFATVSGIGSADIGRVIDIIAPATNNNAPTIPNGSVFILKDDSTWTANPGSRISFKIFDDNTLIEVDGSKVQTA